MSKGTRIWRMFAAVMLTGTMIFGGCVSGQTWRNIAATSAATVAATALNLTVITAMENALKPAE